MEILERDGHGNGEEAKMQAATAMTKRDSGYGGGYAEKNLYQLNCEVMEALAVSVQSSVYGDRFYSQAEARAMKK